MSESDIKALALFFYFALLDNRKAIDLSISALGICNDLKKQYPQLKSSVLVISATAEVWRRQQFKIQRGLPNTSVDSGWLIPPDVDLGPWREFQKNANDDELPTVIWSRILNYSDEDISEGLGLTTGTVRYRLARSFRKLGGMIHTTLKKGARGHA